MRKYSNVVIGGLIWLTNAFCGPEDVAQFLISLPAKRQADVKVTSTVYPDCAIARRQSGLTPRLDDNILYTVFYRVDANMIADDGSLLLPGGE